MFLLDTNVVSELRCPRPHGAVLAWLQDGAKAAALENWLDQVASVWNVLPMDATVFRAWARLMHGRSDTLYEDAMIAATAQVHGLTVVTRNVGDFRALGMSPLNPFETAPPAPASR